MSLVAYGSSDESADEEDTEINKKVFENSVQPLKVSSSSISTQNQQSPFVEGNSSTIDLTDSTKSSGSIQFINLPKPEKIDSGLLLSDLPFENPTKRNRVPVKITVPSLAEFADVEEENRANKKEIKPSKQGTGLLSLLPPLRGVSIKNAEPLVPRILTKKPVDKISSKLQDRKASSVKTKGSSTVNTIVTKQAQYPLDAYKSTSEDDDVSNVNTVEKTENADFFSLLEIGTVSDNNKLSLTNVDSLSKTNLAHIGNDNKSIDNRLIGTACNYNITYEAEHFNEIPHDKTSEKILVSNVMNLPKDDIILKNKAEVGPKLPVPEQEYNVDSKGNVIFDEKAIEYLCGKRGVKRKDRGLDEANIIEINEEDIKPDEREWMIKAMTDESMTRPISVQSGGPSSQSKKKHQITYLAQQAKAMEIELKNQWAQNRMSRKQTQSKYGF